MFRRDWVDWICSVIPAVAWWLEKAHWLDRRFFADQPTPPCAADAGANAIKVMPRVASHGRATASAELTVI